MEDTKEIIRIRKPKKTTQGPKGQTTIYNKTKDRVTRIPLKPGVKSGDTET